MQSLGFGLPTVESARDANGRGHRIGEFKANGHQLGAGAREVVVVMIMFHIMWA